MSEPVEPPQRTRIRLSAAEREQQLLDVAEQLFTDHGYEGVALDDISRAAGVSRPIVYQHHGSKEGIFLACVRRARQQFRSRVAESIAAAGPTLGDHIDAGGAPYFDLIEHEPRRWALLFTTSASLNGDLSEALVDLRFNSVIEISAATRRFAPDALTDDLIAFSLAVSGIGEQLGRWWLRRPDVPRADVLRRYRTLIIGAGQALLGLDASNKTTIRQQPAELPR
jgi:AcrR family transcriptional regulator